ncbi:hypothetical protein COO91_10188 (plasmid) [Nostoc flagelliforme CCNUN1]|uniref:Laminin G domain-containing protein n=1 Tax=Nostoc flagelliforme CCNUN1 TaxID=2038116 RepID=A0A2K8T8F0_9NOSO|nr:LamG domain-containing protein [Nostoc flagelliforme]AUB43974.1 hypothetical protein COO91_10188 [Nostoc flagelliforme CCNUN1]
MQFIKQLGKQLGFVVLIGSAVFPVSSASAQVTTISTNTDVFIDANKLREDPLLFPNATQLDVGQLGGVHFTTVDETQISILPSRATFDPFNTTYENNEPVGASLFRVSPSSVSTTSSSGTPITGTRIDAIFTADPNKFRIGLVDGVPNPPARSLGDLTPDRNRCEFTKCVVLHYGYYINLDSSTSLNPRFLQYVYQLSDINNASINLLQRGNMASPEVNTGQINVNLRFPKNTHNLALLIDDIKSSRKGTKTQRHKEQFVPKFSNAQNLLLTQNTQTEYLVVYSEQKNPQQPGAVIVNWTQFPIPSGQTPTLRFTNSSFNSRPMTVSNTRVLQSATEIPLEKLNAVDLPPTTEGFVPVPSANGSVAPGETKTPAYVPITNITRVLNYIVSFNGTSDFLEIPNNENLNFGTGDLSISAWVKTTSTSGLEVILDKRVETTGPVQGYSLSNSNGNLLLQLADGVGNQFTNYVSNISIADGNWHYVAVTVDRDQPDGGRWYLDGVEVVGERFNPTTRGSLSNSKPLVIGRRSDNPGWPGFFRGQISSVRLDKRVLSSQEIQAIAANRP